MADKPKRAWRIVHSESSTGWGGQEHRVLAELAGFQRRGSHVWLLAPVESQIFRRARETNVPAAPLPGAKWRFPFAVLGTARWLRRLKPDVVNTHSSRDGWVAGLAARMAGVPFIIRTRHIDVDYPNRWLSRHAFTTLADHVLTTSHRITRHFQEMFDLPDARITTVPTGIDLNAFSPEGEVADLVSHAEGAPLVGMVSVLRSWKGHATLLEAAARLRAAGFAGRFVIVGEGPMRQRIEQQVTDLNLGSVVTLTGHREDVPAVLRALSALVIPSTKHEGVPQIGLQALAVKTPVVGSNVGGIPEVIRPGETGRIVSPENPAALAAAIRETLADADATRAMAERGRALVEARYSLEAMLDTLESLYWGHIPPERVDAAR